MKTSDQPADGPRAKQSLSMWNPGNFGSLPQLKWAPGFSAAQPACCQAGEYLSGLKKLSAFIGGVILALTLAGCATTPPPIKGNADLLSFLSDGKTTRTEAITTLGQPSGTFEAQRILTYRLGYEPENHGYAVVERETTVSGWPTWPAAKFSLVLVFDDAGILQKHSLVKVNQ
jgi:hypothetical protein